MEAKATAFWVPKLGNSTEEYEDAFGLNAQGGQFAVADGASESSFAREWAKLLVDRFVAEPPANSELSEWIKPAQKTWGDQHKNQDALPWYAQEKARAGAFATLLGLCLDCKTGSWESLAVGDSCAVLVRSNKIVWSFPQVHSSQFHNRPLLLSSVDKSNQGVWGAVAREKGTCQEEDLFLLMTDALAAWFLGEAEMGRHPWTALLCAKTPEDFARLVEFLRLGKALHNDDTTLVFVEVA